MSRCTRWSCALLCLLVGRALAGGGTWGVVAEDGAHRATAPALSSLCGGEPATGAVRSAPFTIPAGATEYRFLANGHDGQRNDRGKSGFALCDAATGAQLRWARPPGNDAFTPVVWPIADLAGKSVYFRAVDDNADGAYAWLGCKDVPLADLKPCVFQPRQPLTGWFAEVDGGLEPLTGAPFDAKRAVEQDWARQDRLLGLSDNPATIRALLGRMFARGERLSTDFHADPAPIAALRAKAAATPDQARPLRALYLEARRTLRTLALSNPRLPQSLLFVQRFTQQSYSDINVNHQAWGSRPGGDILLLSPLGPEGTAKGLLAGRLGPGNVHGIDLSFDGRKLVFAYAKAKSDQPPKGWTTRQMTMTLHQTEDLLHLYTMNVDGSDLKQITSGPWSDLNPCWLPGGKLAFESERCGLELECNELDKDEPTTNLFVAEADGSNPRRLSYTKDGDWYPRVLNDGRIIYSHWEYHERDWSLMHPLWVVSPDGTGANAWFKQHLNLPATLTVPRAVPDSPLVLALAAGHHTLAAGPVVLLDPRKGMNSPAGIERLTGPNRWPEYNKGPVPGPSPAGWAAAPGDGWYMDPWPLDEHTYLAAYCDGAMADEAGYALYLLDVYGGKELLYRDPSISSVMPIPLAARPEPPVIPDARQRQTPDAEVCLTNVEEGLDGVAPGTVKYLRIAEPVAWTYSQTGGGTRYHPDAKATGTSWTPIRILGTVPVAADGSAHFRVPADTAVYFQALDANFMEVRRMRSYVSFQAGEVRGCNGCHETRASAPPVAKGVGLALALPPVEPQAPPWGAVPVSFLRDVQPVLDRRCGACHAGLKPAAGLDLSGGLTAEHNRAYDTLVQGRSSRWVSVSNKHDDAKISLPRMFGSARSKLVAVLGDARHAGCGLTEDERRRVYAWIDANAVYHDRNIDKRPADGAPYNLAADKALWTQVGDLQQKSCAGCHAGVNLARSDWVDLWEPGKSRLLACPRAPHAAEWQALKTLVETAVARTWERPRRDLQSLRREARP